MKVILLSPKHWKLEPHAVQRRGARATRGLRRDTQLSDTAVLPEAFVPAGAEITASGMAKASRQATSRSTSSTVQPLEIGVECAANERVLLAVRMPSGALKFIAPIDRVSRGRAAAITQARFIITPPRGQAKAARRGLVSDVIEWVVIKIGRKLVDAAAGKAIQWLASEAENRWWGERKEGLFRVRCEDGALQLEPVAASKVSGPALLLLHGTFSHAAAAFNDLAKTSGDFFKEAERTYGTHIYAWNHFTVSKSPEDNVRELLDALPATNGGVEFDVITHSRGGLVLRTLVERASLFGKKASRFRLRRAALVASPNAGTPLATPERWEETLGFVSNILEFVGPNPWTTAASFVADGLVWLAARLAGDLPGLASMDAGGETIGALQESSVLEAGSYAALTSNFHPTESIFQRLLDAGVDGFFQGANDLVVPAEGSWLADGAGEIIPADRIGCFGNGGNLAAIEPVHHLNYFRQSATIEFLKRTFELPAQLPSWQPLDPATMLPTRSVLSIASRRGRGLAAARAPEVASSARSSPSLDQAVGGSLALPETAYADRTLHLLILEAPEIDPQQRVRREKMIIATYSNARVIAVFPTRDPDADKRGQKTTSKDKPSMPLNPGQRFQRIIKLDRTIRMCLNGQADSDGEVPELPTDGLLGDLGEWLFRALFIDDVRRLYDAARSEQRGRPLNIVLTCSVKWIAALPWEFAFDPLRQKFLASEDVHFTRGVVASVPAEVITRRSDKLRLLIVSAQPIDASRLSIDEEQERIQHAFHSLTSSGLVEIDMLMDASPRALHEYILGAQVQGRNYDVVHFISHGEYEPDAEGGKLLLVSSDGSRQELELRPLREMLCSRSIHLVFVNACESGVGFQRSSEPSDAPRAITARRGERGIAQSLVEGGLPAVVANQYTVLDTAALAFAEWFYHSLALGASLGQAAREARIALNYAVDGEAIDWAVPVLYARDPDLRLCSPSAETRISARTRRPAPARATSDSMMRSSRSCTGSDRIRVGIADISSYFPKLPEIIARLNTVQEAFEFIPVAVTIPLGVWESVDWGPEEGGKVRYLWAERFGRKMKHKPERLGVHYLICATHHMMRDDNTYNLYGWWSSSKECRVMLFSTGGLALPRDGDAAGLTVANAIVQSLAAQITEEAGAPTAIHGDGAHDCPFYYNEARVEAAITGANRFDGTCRDYVRKHVPPTVNGVPRAVIIKAFDELLKCFAPRPKRTRPQ